MDNLFYTIRYFFQPWINFCSFFFFIFSVSLCPLEVLTPESDSGPPAALYEANLSGLPLGAPLPTRRGTASALPAGRPTLLVLYSTSIAQIDISFVRTVFDYHTPWGLLDFLSLTAPHVDKPAPWPPTWHTYRP